MDFSFWFLIWEDLIRQVNPFWWRTWKNSLKKSDNFQIIACVQTFPGYIIRNNFSVYLVFSSVVNIYQLILSWSYLKKTVFRKKMKENESKRKNWWLSMKSKSEVLLFIPLINSEIVKEDVYSKQKTIGLCFRFCNQGKKQNLHWERWKTRKRKKSIWWTSTKRKNALELFLPNLLLLNWKSKSQANIYSNFFFIFYWIDLSRFYLGSYSTFFPHH